MSMSRSPGRTASRPPEEFPQRILLAMVGLAPQIVTETLWCLANRTPPFVPTRIEILTTLAGKRRCEAALLDPGVGALAALADDLNLPALGQALDISRIHVIARPDGNPLEDIEDAADSEAAADSIHRVICALTQDEDAALHVSIAGGRKTMGFFAGYALSLHGREQDRLSHVLVSAPFEQHSDFFFPPRRPVQLVARNGAPLDTAAARLSLAEIPFVRLRHGVDGATLARARGYSDLVETMARRFHPPRLAIDLAVGVALADERVLALQPLTLALLTLLAEAAKEGRSLSWRNCDYARLDRYRQIASRAGPQAAAPRVLTEDDREVLFREQMSKLRRALRLALDETAPVYMPLSLGRRPLTEIKLPLPPAAIEIHRGARDA
jgi:CRISPR-associated protein (TIGR02584 family)